MNNRKSNQKPETSNQTKKPLSLSLSPSQGKGQGEGTFACPLRPKLFFSGYWLQVTGFSKRGFTLIEMIVTIVISGLIAAVIAPMISAADNAIATHETRANLQEMANYGLTKMSRDIRRIKGSCATDGGGNPIPFSCVYIANGTTFEFDDVDGVRITYLKSGTTITRKQSAAGTARVLVNSILSTGNAFTYYDSSDAVIPITPGPPPTPTVSPSTNIKTIEINMTFASGTIRLPLRIQIRPRNLQ